MYTASNIASVNDIEKSCKEIQPFLEAHFDADNPQAVIDRSNDLSSYMALSSKMYADARYRYNEVLNSVFIEAVKTGNANKMQTSTLNKYIDSLCKDYSYLVDWTERINRACTHQLDMCRSLLSKLKAEMQMTR